MSNIIKHAPLKLQALLRRLHAKRTYGVWVPTRTANGDIVLTDKNACRVWRLTVRTSRDYLRGTQRNKHNKYAPPQIPGIKIIVTTWFTFRHAELSNSKEDFLVLMLGTQHGANHCVVINPGQLLKALQATYGTRNKYHMYIAVSNRQQVFDWRGLRGQIPASTIVGTSRDYTQFYNAWP